MRTNGILFVGALYHVAMFVFHLLFWKLFYWKADLPSISPVNRAIMQVLNLCLMFVFLMFGYISAFHAPELATTALGRALLAMIAIFWLLRALEQVLFFKLRRRTSVVYAVIFLMGAALYFIPALKAAPG